MRFSTSGSLRRIDVSLLASAIEALRDEWAALRFGTDGVLVNPVTGAPYPDLRLVEGRHRAPGARYEVVTRTPALEPNPVNDQRGAISVPTGVTETTSTVVLRTDDSRHLAVTIGDARELWTVDVDMTHARLPRFDVAGRFDATAMIAAEGVPGCLSRLLGGVADGTATVDLAAIERRRRSTLAQASGRFNRFRGSGSVSVKTSARTWEVSARATVRGKGLARLVMPFVAGRLRRAFDDEAATFWDDTARRVDDAARELARIEDLVATEGGVGTVIHRLMWEEGYGDRLDALLGTESQLPPRR
ncbi:hypothetical protein [Aeromicrobium wangtongii]|uniref:hypothetical protein n=1 Tax=Aeromicrobium wangtongii TaxID=2969247 RepID=UPI00201729EC|nr:hypothetical protein [Aeromicrobium wangtongii]MCL3817062.1 hypothetical protein [Aeromicrobium wangtongii]